jgi:hypothetical protein
MGDSDIDHPSQPSADSSAYADETSGLSSAAPKQQQPAYTRPRKQRRAQGTINDLDQDSAFPSDGSYAHDSNFAVGGTTPFAGRQYRRSRSDIDKLQRDSQYGHYLQIPKGKRSIFVSRERTRRRNAMIAVVVIVALIIIMIAFAAHLIVANMG